MLAADAAAGYVTYLTYIQRISYQYGILIFVPIFISSYWFATFFNQLIAPKSGLLISKPAYNILYAVSSLISVGLLGSWAYLFFSRSLYASV